MSYRRGGFTPGRWLTALLWGQRSGPPPSVLNYLAQHYDDEIVAIEVHRMPITKAEDGLAQFITLGEWGLSKKAAGYDQVFHIAIVLTVRCPLSSTFKTVVIEKRPVVKIRDGTIGGEIRSSKVPKGLRLGDFITRSAKRIGGRFWDYDPEFYNCQDLVLNILKTWNLLTPELYQFIKQPMTKLFKPWLTYTMTAAASDLASRADIIFHGGCHPLPCL